MKAAVALTIERFEQAVPAAFAGDGVAFLQTVYRDPALPLAVRLDAAAKAARFERPMLTATNMRVIRGFEDLTNEELTVLAGDPDRRTDEEQRQEMRH